MGREVVHVHGAVRGGSHPDQERDRGPQHPSLPAECNEGEYREDQGDPNGHEALLNRRMACPQCRLGGHMKDPRRDRHGKEA